MSPARLWADLHSELLVSIAASDGVSLRDYKCLRGVCAAWRSALKPPYPCLLSLAEHKHSAWPGASVFSLPTQRSSHLQTASSRPFDSQSLEFIGQARIIGSSNGRFAVAVDQDPKSQKFKHQKSYGHMTTMRIFLLNTRAGKEVQLATPTATCWSGACYEYVHKVVFAPAPHDHTVVALYDRKHVAYMDITTSRHNWTTIGVVTSNDIADLAFDEDGKLYCLDTDGGVQVVSIPGCDRNGQNKHAVVEPLVCKPNALAAFVPPYDSASTVAETVTKHIFFCNGSMYQMWQNKGATVTLGGGRFRMTADEIFVLRYDPQSWPCWDMVRDLGGCSVFIGKNNNPAVVRPAGGHGQSWVRADCVYWIDWMGVPMVCDVGTGTSRPCVLPYGACKGNSWYFHNDIDIDGDKTKRRN